MKQMEKLGDYVERSDYLERLRQKAKEYVKKKEAEQRQLLQEESRRSLLKVDSRTR